MNQQVMDTFKAAVDTVYNTSGSEEVNIVYKFLRNRLHKGTMLGSVKALFDAIEVSLKEGEEYAYKNTCMWLEILKKEFGDPIADPSLQTDSGPKEVSKEEERKAAEWATGDLSKGSETNNYPPSESQPPSGKDFSVPETKEEPKESFFSKYKTPLIIGGSLVGLGVVALLLLGKKKEDQEEQLA